MVLTLENEAAVDLVAQHHDVAIADRARDTVDVILSQHAAGRVLWRIQDDQLRALVDQPSQFVDVEPEIHLLT